MRILYGIQTTGNGHLSRSSLMVRHLKNMGHDVHVLFSGAFHGNFWDISLFEPYTRCKGLTFVTRNGRIDTFRTALNLDLFTAYRDIYTFRDRDFDVVVSDFEPISSRIAKRSNIPAIGVSHQCAFRYDIPTASFNPQGRLVTRIFAPTRINLGLHWHHFGQPVLPPIIDTSMDPGACTREPGKILVYLPFEEREKIRAAFRELPDLSFHIYEKRESPLVDFNLKWNPFSRDGFKNDLLSCDGVICQSGFELPSEALHLGKKLLVKPVYGQYEQLSNARVINQYDLGMAVDEITSAHILRWVSRDHPQPANYPDVARYIAQWIGEKQWHDTRGLSDRLWKMTRLELTREASQGAAYAA